MGEGPLEILSKKPRAAFEKAWAPESRRPIPVSPRSRHRDRGRKGGLHPRPRGVPPALSCPRRLGRHPPPAESGVVGGGEFPWPEASSARCDRAQPLPATKQQTFPCLLSPRGPRGERKDVREHILWATSSPVSGRKARSPNIVDLFGVSVTLGEIDA